HGGDAHVVGTALDGDPFEVGGPIRGGAYTELGGKRRERLVDGFLARRACGRERFVGTAGARVKPSLQWAVRNRIRRVPVDGRGAAMSRFAHAVDYVSRYGRPMLHLVVTRLPDRKAARHRP